MEDKDLGTATIVYDDPDEGTVEETVENEHIAYFQDHWLIRRDEDEAGNDIVRRIPIQRVHYVERSVEAFEDEVGTLKNRVESVAEDLREKVLGGREQQSRERHEPVEIEVESDSESEQ